MEAVIVSDYFYGEESEQFSYFRIPRLLVRSKKFKMLSTDAKLLYGLMLDRMGLSAKHGWHDELGRVYIYYTLDEIQTDLICCHHASGNRRRFRLKRGQRYAVQSSTGNNSSFCRSITLIRSRSWICCPTHYRMRCRF